MKRNEKILQTVLAIVQEKSFSNLVVFLLVFPVYLYFVKTEIVVLSVPGLLTLAGFGAYLWGIYRRQWRQYQVPVNFILAATFFMRVIAGNTIPAWLVVGVLGVLMFLTQEVISYNEYRSSELMRQIVLSSVIFSTFLMYSYVFGSIFINNLGPIWLGVVCFAVTVNVASFIFYIYRLRGVWVLSLMIGLVATQLYIGLRVMPYGHLTLSVLLMVFVFFSIIMFRDACLSQLSRRRVLSRVISMVALIAVIVVTAHTAVIQ